MNCTIPVSFEPEIAEFVWLFPFDAENPHSL